MKSNIAWLAGAAVLYVLLARAGMALLALAPGNLALLWLPAGLGLIMWQRAGWHALPFIFLASFAASYSSMAAAGSLLHGLTHTAVSAAADCIMPWLAMVMLRRFLPSGLHTAGALFPFVIFVCAVPASVTAVISSLNLVAGDYLSWEAGLFTFRMLLVSDSLGVILLYPLYMNLKSRGLPENFDVWQFLFSALIVVLGVQLSYSAVPGIIHLLLPFLLSLAISDKKLEMLFLLLLAVVTILLKSAENLGPFAIADVNEGLFMLMIFIIVLCLLPLGMLLYKQELEDSIARSRLWQKRAGTDHLTGLSNRHAFMPMLNDEFLRANRHQRPFSLAMIDIDDFKGFNDTHGHLVGDKVLKAFARFMLREVRAIDVVCRFGGEEFYILFPETPVQYAASAMERLRARLEQEGLEVEGERVALTVSIGLVSHDGGEASLESLLDTGDRLMYTAKHSGRNRVVMEDAAVNAREGDDLQPMET